MKKKIKYILIAAAAALALFALYHFYGGNIYSFLFFRDSQVKEISDSLYRCPKEDPEVFVDYMEDRGYTLTDRLGAGFVFEKDDERIIWVLKTKDLYAQWTA